MLKVLNNIGIIGSILAGIGEVVFVTIFVVGIHIEQDVTSTILFAIVNALIGVLINILLRYQGQKYAEIENQKLCEKFYSNKVKKEKKYISMTVWNLYKTAIDVIIKGGSAAFSIFGVIYISIEGSQNPIQILITLATLILFACFGLMNMNSSYTRYYNVQVPYMEFKIKENEMEETNLNGTV